MLEITCKYQNTLSEFVRYVLITQVRAEKAKKQVDENHSSVTNMKVPWLPECSMFLWIMLPSPESPMPHKHTQIVRHRSKIKRFWEFYCTCTKYFLKLGLWFDVRNYLHFRSRMIRPSGSCPCQSHPCLINIRKLWDIGQKSSASENSIVPVQNTFWN